MISIDVLLTFIAASALLSLAPGPDNIFVLTLSAVNGRESGLLVTLGLCTGLMFHTAAVVLGVAAVFQVNAVAFTALKIIGGCYLLYLAWQAFRASSKHLESTERVNLGSMALYKRGLIMNITNPKVAIFFLAFLPQFADASRGSIAVQMIVLGAIFIVVALMIFSMIAILSGYLNSWFSKSDKSQAVLNKVAGTVFIGLALKLLLSEK